MIGRLSGQSWAECLINHFVQRAASGTRLLEQRRSQLRVGPSCGPQSQFGRKLGTDHRLGQGVESAVHQVFGVGVGDRLGGRLAIALDQLADGRSQKLFTRTEVM